MGKKNKYNESDNINAQLFTIAQFQYSHLRYK